MRLAISNIAWDTIEDQQILKLLKRFRIDAIDIAPGKYFPELLKVTDSDICVVKNKWLDQGIEIVGMQALLFGTKGLNIFGSPEIRAATLRYLTAVCRVSLGLGAKYLVFGSPKNRDRGALSDVQALEMARNFFKCLGDIAQDHGLVICLEPNPACYGANFMLTHDEVLKVVKQVAHPAVKMQLDTGALLINQEKITEVLKNCSSSIGHIHLSEPNLVPLGDANTNHKEIAMAVKTYFPQRVASIEMLATTHELHTLSIERSLSLATRYYGQGA